MVFFSNFGVKLNLGHFRNIRNNFGVKLNLGLFRNMRNIWGKMSDWRWRWRVGPARGSMGHARDEPMRRRMLR